MKLLSRDSAFSIPEVAVASAVAGAVGMAIFSLLNTGMILEAKNVAVNTAHQQARTAMAQMVQDIHSSVSLPFLTDANGVKLAATPGSAPAAAGIGFQLYGGGPYKVVGDAATSTDKVLIWVPNGYPVPAKDQVLVVPTHQIELDIKKVTSKGSGKYELELISNLPRAIKGTGSPTFDNIVCFTTDRCSYTVVNKALQWKGPTTKKAFALLGSGITNEKPFSTPLTAAGAYDYKFIAAIDLSTADMKYTNRDFKSANILLNGRVGTRTRLTTYQ